MILRDPGYILATEGLRNFPRTTFGQIYRRATRQPPERKLIVLQPSVLHPHSQKKARRLGNVACWLSSRTAAYQQERGASLHIIRRFLCSLLSDRNKLLVLPTFWTEPARNIQSADKACLLENPPGLKTKNYYTSIVKAKY